MDEFVDSLLREDRVCDTILPRLTKRFVLEERGELEKRVSMLEQEMLLEEEERLVREQLAQSTVEKEGRNSAGISIIVNYSKFYLGVRGSICMRK